MLILFMFGLYFIASILLVVGGLNWGVIGAFDFNAVSYLSKKLSIDIIQRVVYALVGCAALVHLFRRDFYLPFLGTSVYPCGSLVPKKPVGADTSVTITTAPNVNVIYWASEPNSSVHTNPWIAYDQYANAGVARSDEHGRAELHVRRPSAYKVPTLIGRKLLSPHIHYRVCTTPGLVGSVQTVQASA